VPHRDGAVLVEQNAFGLGPTAIDSDAEAHEGISKLTKVAGTTHWASAAEVEA
jgi:hypothetical protein